MESSAFLSPSKPVSAVLDQNIFLSPNANSSTFSSLDFRSLSGHCWKFGAVSLYSIINTDDVALGFIQTWRLLPHKS